MSERLVDDGGDPRFIGPTGRARVEERAAQVYNKTLAGNPEDGECWFKLAEVLLSLNREDEAIDAYERSIETNSSKAGVAASTVSNLFANAGRYDEALKASERALNLTSPDDIRNKKLALWTKGSILTMAERPEEALQAFDEALRLDPEDKMTLMSRADALSDLHRYNESIEAYQKVIEQAANDSSNWITNALIGMGDALNATGRRDEALDAYRSLLEVKEMEIEKNPEDSRC